MNNNIGQNLQTIEKLLAEKAWWTSFLAEGAFFRESEESLWIWIPKACVGEVESSKNTNISIGYKTFFSHKSLSADSSLTAVQVPLMIFRRALSKQIESDMAQSKDLLKQNDFLASTKESFEKSLREILLKINRGEIEKAVPVTFTRSTKAPSSADKLRWIAKTLGAPINLWAFGFWRENEVAPEGIIGATPEILFDLKEGRLEAMALAGTMPKAEAQERGSLLTDLKEKWEHDLVVQDLKTQLGKFGGVVCSPTSVIELPTLFHLRTLIEVSLSSGVFSSGTSRKKFVDDLVHMLHPTPALGVSPRSYGYQWMKDLPDQEDRQLHGGPIAFSLPHRTLCLVAIRNVQWNKSRAQIGAGCGIVRESQPEREWNEVSQKINSVFQILGIE